jgi:hypothetical protein
VIRADALGAINQLRLQDYYTSVPGLNVMPEASSSFQQLSIRGITTGGLYKSDGPNHGPTMRRTDLLRFSAGQTDGDA